MKTYTLIIASAVALISLNTHAGTDAIMNIVEPESADIFIGSTGTNYNSQYAQVTSSSLDVGSDLNSDELHGEEVIVSNTLTIASVINQIEGSPTAAGRSLFEDAGYQLNNDESLVD